MITEISFNPTEVLESHRRAIETRNVLSVVPDVTSIDVDTESLINLSGVLGAARFSRSGFIRARPANLMGKTKFLYRGEGLVDITGIEGLGGEQLEAASRKRLGPRFLRHLFVDTKSGIK